MKISFNKSSGYTEITLKNSKGLEIRLASLGASIREIRVPDKNRETKTVTLCPVKEEDYAWAYHGKTIGRTSGRICGAEFTIDGKTAKLDKNNYGTDNLHGGAGGLHAVKYGSEVRQNKEYTDVMFNYSSPDGEGGYFGNVKIVVTYRIFEKENTFRIIYDATADTKTLLNLTNHVYWNMGGNLEENAKNQTLYINAPEYGRLNERLIVEEIAPVTVEMDFRKPHKIGDNIYNVNVQRYTKGYDHPYFLAPHKFSDLACSLSSEKSGITLEVRTTYPCVVFYANGKANGEIEVYPDKFDEQYLAICLECQYHPDGVHACPDNCGIISPDKPYREEIEYKFSVK